MKGLIITLNSMWKTRFCQ